MTPTTTARARASATMASSTSRAARDRRVTRARGDAGRRGRIARGWTTSGTTTTCATANGDGASENDDAVEASALSRATRAFARGAAEAVGGGVEEEEEDVVVERLGVRKSLLESDEDEAEARARAMVNMARLSASGGGEVMRRIPEDVLPLLLRLPSAGADAEALRRSAEGLTAWKEALARGLLPDAEIPWPEDDTFREALVEALGDLDMARFTRRFPPVLDTLMKNILDILYIYERDRVDEGEPEMPPSEPRESMSSNEGEGEGEAQGDGAGESSEEEGDGDEQTQASGQGGGGDETDGEDNVDEFDVGMDLSLIHI